MTEIKQKKQVEEKKSLEEYFEGMGIDRVGYPRLLLKLRYTLENMGITQVHYKKYLKSMDIFNELTLAMYPSTPSGEGNNFISGSNRESSSFGKKMIEIDGYNHNYIYYNKYFDSEGIPIKIKVDGEEEEIGLYIKNKNLLLLHHRFFYFFDYKNSNKEEDNKGIYFFINALKEFVIQHKVKTEDLTEVIKNRAIEVFKDGLKTEINTSSKTITQIENDIISYSNSLKEKYFKKEKEKRSIINLTLMLKDLEKSILKQIEEIKSLPFVKSVRLLLKGIKIDIGKVHIKGVYIGEFIIYITPKDIKIENISRQDRDKQYIHPHIGNGDSGICFGNRKNLVYELLAKYEYKKLTYFLYLYLKSYNKEDRYNSIEYWGGDNNDF